MRLIAIAAVLLGLAGCVSPPSVSKSNLTGISSGDGLPPITHRTYFQEGADGARDGRLDPERTAPNS